jgi:UDP-MurNAc hydroxylase
LGQATNKREDALKFGGNSRQMNHINFRFLGHNCFLLETETEFFTIDPWLSDRGAFYGSWFQYPKNHQYQSVLERLSSQKKGWAYITHEHQDHFDIDTLSKLDRRMMLVIPSLADKFLLNKTRELKFPSLELKDSTEVELSDWLKVTSFISDVGINHDSALLIRAGELIFFNQNDCKIFDRLSLLPKGVTYYSVQFSGATSHPACYDNYSEADRIRISAEKARKKLDNVVKAIGQLKPKYFIPAAGPAIFPYLPKELSLGRGNIFIHQPELSTYLRDRGIENILYPRPGDTIDDRTDRHPIPPPTGNDLDAYREGLKDEWGSIDIAFDRQKFEGAIEERLDQIRDLRTETETTVVFEWGEGDDDRIYVDLGLKRITGRGHPDKVERIYKVRAAKKYFALMSGEERWQDISLSLRATTYRSPDAFDNFVNLFLFSDVSNLRDSVIETLAIPDERIVVQTNKCRYEINRFCPHQGADLSNAAITEDGILTCPRHSWRFDLNNDGKVANSTLGINARLIT